MCEMCEAINETVTPEKLDELLDILKDLDEDEAVTTMSMLESDPYPFELPSPDDFNTAVEAVLSVAKTYPFQVSMAAQDAIKYWASLREIIETQFDTDRVSGVQFGDGNFQVNRF